MLLYRLDVFFVNSKIMFLLQVRFNELSVLNLEVVYRVIVYIVNFLLSLEKLALSLSFVVFFRLLRHKYLLELNRHIDFFKILKFLGPCTLSCKLLVVFRVLVIVLYQMIYACLFNLPVMCS